jgi:hypothetical protein
MIDNVFISCIPDALESWCDSLTALCNFIDQIVHPLTDDAPIVQLGDTTTPGFRKTCAQLWLRQDTQRGVSERFWRVGDQDVALMLQRQSLDAFRRRDDRRAERQGFQHLQARAASFTQRNHLAPRARHLTSNVRHKSQDIDAVARWQCSELFRFSASGDTQSNA